MQPLENKIPKRKEPPHIQNNQSNGGASFRGNPGIEEKETEAYVRKENEDENKPGRKEEDDELRCKENENGGAEETPEKRTERIGEKEQKRSGARKRGGENSENGKGTE